ncbi:hypothetical protein WJX72_003716 [[Myrmecia] bisecta]|uniref:Kelch repeat-containing protein n=1 Tax=[Myrmecia] bisecta TaxID=41462 RepID=A0AAW1PJI7_9CHLO
MAAESWHQRALCGGVLPKLWGHTACLWEGKLYVYTRGLKQPHDLVCIDCRSLAVAILTTSGPCPSKRDTHTASLVGSKMVMFGGSDGKTSYNEVYVCDLRTLEWSVPKVWGSPPRPRDSHSAVVYGQSIIVFGGSVPEGASQNGSGGDREPDVDVETLDDSEDEAPQSNDVYTLDTNRWCWARVNTPQPLPAARESHIAAVTEQQVVVHGGDSGGVYSCDLWALHPQPDLTLWRWQQLKVRSPEQPAARAGHAAVATTTGIYMFGGVDGSLELYFNDCWRLRVGPDAAYGLGTDEAWWSRVTYSGEPPEGRYLHTLSHYDDELYLLGGSTSDGRLLAELHTLKLTPALELSLDQPPAPPSIKLAMQPLPTDPPSGLVRTLGGQRE